MKKKWLATFMLGSSLVLGACGGGEEAEEGASVDPNERVAQQRCGTCHGGNLQGMGTTPALNDIGARLSEEEILEIILEGTSNGMPPGLVKGEEAEELAAWLAEKK